MHKEKLLALAAYMRRVKEPTYDQDVFFTGAIDKDKLEVIDLPMVDNRYVDEPVKAVKLTEGFCGSAACVLGHAAVAPDFPELVLVVGDRAFQNEGKVVTMWPSIGHIEDGMVNNTDPISSAATVFGISTEEASVLFGSSSDLLTWVFYNDGIAALEDACEKGSFTNLAWIVTPQQVADRIESYVADPTLITNLVSLIVEDEAGVQFDAWCLDVDAHDYDMARSQLSAIFS